jgi:hypothetical protein
MRMDYGDASLPVAARFGISTKMDQLNAIDHGRDTQAKSLRFVQTT